MAPLTAFHLALAAGIVALGWAWQRAAAIHRRPAGDRRLVAVAEAIREGAAAFLRRAYRAVGVFTALLAGGILLAARLGHPQLTAATAVAFLAGAGASLLAGYSGMRVAVQANGRTAQAAQHSLGAALAIAFDGGSVVGFAVAGLGLLGVAGVLYAFGDPARPATLEVVNGLALGASSVALFARVGGGIYTKGADVAADLVGKWEAGIPEDDARNPAVIADNVGDNVGDVAGMGADLFESYVGSLAAAVAIAASAPASPSSPRVLLPLALAATGILASLLGTLWVRLRAGHTPAAALRGGTWLAAIAFAIGAWWITASLFRAPELLVPVLTGQVLALAVGQLTERATGTGRSAVAAIARSAGSGPATTVIEGLALGMGSTAAPVTLVAAAVLLAYRFAGLYGVALAAVGMLATIAIHLAVDAYGPIADNAGGIAQMAGLPPEVRARTDQLDAVGNTTAAMGKGIAIGSAALTALALFAAYAARAQLRVIDLTRPAVVAGLLAGGTLPFLFSALCLRAVGRSALQMVAEVRRQFRERPGILQGRVRPDYARCVAISTSSALRQMLLPGAEAVALPLAVGLALGRETLAGLLAGALVSGVALAVFAANAGGAMDNAKKMIEAGAGDGKGSDAHRAAVIGDTVGDPLKDAAGPSLNILIKLMAIVALVFVPLFR